MSCWVFLLCITQWYTLSSLLSLSSSLPVVLPADYPYCLVSKELKNAIRSLLGKSSGVLELFFDHCIYTMLQELDKTPGEHPFCRVAWCWWGF